MNINGCVSEAIHDIYIKILGKNVVTFEDFVKIAKSKNIVLHFYPKSFFYGKLIDIGLFSIYSDCIKIHRIMLYNCDNSWSSDCFIGGTVSVFDWKSIDENIYVSYINYSNDTKLFVIRCKDEQYKILVPKEDAESKAYTKFKQIVNCDHKYPIIVRSDSTYGVCSDCGYINEKAYRIFCDSCDEEIKNNIYFVKGNDRICRTCKSYTEVRTTNDMIIKAL